MRTLLGAVAGSLAVIAVLVAYDLGERHTFSRDAMLTPTTQMVIGRDGVARPYLLSGTYEQTPYTTVADRWSPYPSAAPSGAHPVQMQTVADRVATEQPVAGGVTRSVTSARAVPQRSWQKSALLIGGSAGTGAGLGALMGGKKGALAGAAIGGGAAAIYDQVKRH